MKKLPDFKVFDSSTLYDKYAEEIYNIVSGANAYIKYSDKVKKDIRENALERYITRFNNVILT